jgi:DNA-binding NarL/FixJ family response regulator
LIGIHGSRLRHLKSLPMLNGWKSLRVEIDDPGSLLGSQSDEPMEGAMLGVDRYGKRMPNEREQRVIELVAQGLKNKEVADQIGTTEHVVKNYLRVIYDKLGLWNRVELALWYEARKFEQIARA